MGPGRTHLSISARFSAPFPASEHTTPILTARPALPQAPPSLPHVQLPLGPSSWPAGLACQPISAQPGPVSTCLSSARLRHPTSSLISAGQLGRTQWGCMDAGEKPRLPGLRQEAPAKDKTAVQRLHCHGGCPMPLTAGVRGSVLHLRALSSAAPLHVRTCTHTRAHRYMCTYSHVLSPSLLSPWPSLSSLCCLCLPGQPDFPGGLAWLTYLPRLCPRDRPHPPLATVL